MKSKNKKYIKPKLKQIKINLNLFTVNINRIGFMDEEGLLLAQGCSAPTCSDVRLKTKVADLNNVLNKLEHVRTVSFYWKKNNNVTNNMKRGYNIGVLAQNLEKEFPELVTKDRKSKYKMVYYGEFVTILLQAVKELSSQNKFLHRRITALEKRN